MKFNLRQGALGDKLAILYMLENHGRRTGSKHVVCGSPFLETIYKLFVFDYVEFFAGFQRTKGVKDLAQAHQDVRSTHFITSVQIYLSNKLSLHPLHCVPLVSKLPKQPKSARTLVQFDGRTCKRRGVAMTRGLMEKAIRTLASYKVAVIGGRETNRYLGHKVEYRLGDLPFLVRELMSCKEFVGCDSGMSHLAGVLGVPSKIVILHNSKPLERTYTMYPNTKTFKRSLRPVATKIL